MTESINDSYHVTYYCQLHKKLLYIDDINEMPKLYKHYILIKVYYIIEMLNLKYVYMGILFTKTDWIELS